MRPRTWFCLFILLRIHKTKPAAKSVIIFIMMLNERSVKSMNIINDVPFPSRYYCLCFNVGQRIKTSFLFFTSRRVTQKRRRRDCSLLFMKIYRLLRFATLMPSFFYVLSIVQGTQKTKQKGRKSFCKVNSLRLISFASTKCHSTSK